MTRTAFAVHQMGQCAPVKKQDPGDRGRHATDLRHILGFQVKAFAP